jgi:hypothetical protein
MMMKEGRARRERERGEERRGETFLSLSPLFSLLAPLALVVVVVLIASTSSLRRFFAAALFCPP